MAACWKCGKRASARARCLWCGRGPMCLKCPCTCRADYPLLAVDLNVKSSPTGPAETPHEKEKQ